MVNYQLGKIYKITSTNTNDVYVGSTCCPRLCTRLSQHRAHYKSYLNGLGHYLYSFEILKHNDYQITLIVDYPCANKDQLRAREQHWMENTPNCINICHRAYNTDEDIKEYQKEYHKVYQKEYYKQNKDTIKDNQKEYKKEYNKRKTYCSYCDKYINRPDNFAQHCKTSSHIMNVDFFDNLIDNI